MNNYLNYINPIISIMEVRMYYVNYCYYVGIILNMSLKTIMSPILFDYYYLNCCAFNTLCYYATIIAMISFLLFTLQLFELFILISIIVIKYFDANYLNYLNYFE